MKTAGNLFFLPSLTAALGLMLAGRVTAQTLTVLHSFTATPEPPRTNSDGAYPWGGLRLILSSSTLYGTARQGGSSGNGTVFALNTDGTGFTVLHSFTASGSSDYYTNSDGANPTALILSGDTLYGTAHEGGSSGLGTVFAVNTDGTSFTNLHSFKGYPSEGAWPNDGLILSGNVLYGTTGISVGGEGTVFALNADGTGFTTLHTFTGDYGGGPEGGLILSGHTLYGTTLYDSGSGTGTVFAVNIDGTGFTNLYNFTARSTNSPYTNSEGAFPFVGLLSGSTLYGTAGQGGSSGNGTVFALNTDGTGFTVLHSFTASGSSGYYTNSDGANPSAALILSGNTLYGTAFEGGSSDDGTVFAVNIDGTAFTNLYNFTTLNPDPSGVYINSDGALPTGLILSGNTLYGAAEIGGSSGNGTIFSISLPVPPPQLVITPSGTNVILTWPTNVTGFTLQSTMNLKLSAVWTTNLPVPVVVNGQNTVTNPISGTQQFFRLSQ